MAPETFLDYSENLEPVQADAEAFVEHIAMNPQVLGLAESFGYEIPRGGSITDRLERLKEFSNATWDSRNGGERWDAVSKELTSHQSDEVFAAAESWNMVRSTEPTKDHYDFVTILGGANMTPLLRVQYAKERLGAKDIQVPYMVLLGSSRQLNDAEKTKTAEYAPGAKDEYDLMNAAVEKVYGVKSEDEQTIDLRNFGASISGPADKNMWRVRYYQTPDGMHIMSVSAPQIEGDKRVNTADTYHFIRDVVGKEMLEGANVLNVTNAHFVPFQHADATRLLGLETGAHVETIGFSADYANIVRKPQDLLQEMNSAINQADLLQKALKQRS